MAALHRALALGKVDDVAVGVAEDLHLDVARVFDELLDVDLGVAEGALGLALRGSHRRRAARRGGDQAHALAASSGGGLEHDRVADGLGERYGFGVDW